MNKQSFIERLNLHLDEELSPEESEELLQAVRENPEYHQIYVQYCQLFNACSQLGEKFIEEKKIRPWRQKMYAFGGMAAAVALLLLAARNLSPFIGGMTEQGLATNLPDLQEAESGVVEPLMVVDVTEIEEQPLLLSEAAVPVSFDLGSAAESRNPRFDFGLDSKIVFAGLTSVPDKEIQTNWVKKVFKFGEAVGASTYEHEALSSESSNERVFSVEAVGSAPEGDSQYEFSRAAAATTTTTAKPSQ